MKAFLLVAAPTLAMAPPSQIVISENNEPSCGGRRYDLVTVPDGGSPYVELVADGISGPFLLDYGATKSSLSAATFAPSNGAIASLSIPGFTRRHFERNRYAKQVQPAQGQIGVIGVDLLSTLTVELNGNAAFLGEPQCKPEQLRARRLIPIAQKRFFHPGRQREVNFRTSPLCSYALGRFGRGRRSTPATRISYMRTLWTLIRLYLNSWLTVTWSLIILGTYRSLPAKAERPATSTD